MIFQNENVSTHDQIVSIKRRLVSYSDDICTFKYLLSFYGRTSEITYFLCIKQLGRSHSPSPIRNFSGKSLREPTSLKFFRRFNTCQYIVKSIRYFLKDTLQVMEVNLL